MNPDDVADFNTAVFSMAVEAGMNPLYGELNIKVTPDGKTVVTAVDGDGQKFSQEFATADVLAAAGLDMEQGDSAAGAQPPPDKNSPPPAGAQQKAQ